jgi:hypothetical protein
LKVISRRAVRSRKRVVRAIRVGVLVGEIVYNGTSFLDEEEAGMAEIEFLVGARGLIRIIRVYPWL